MAATKVKKGDAEYHVLNEKWLCYEQVFQASAEVLQGQSDKQEMSTTKPEVKWQVWDNPWI